MISEEDKYKAYTFNIAGFAAMTPFGKIVLENVKLFYEIGPLALFINIIVGMILFVWGLTLIERGRTILYKHDKKRKTYYDEDRID